jgi:uncharacterized protein involved in exopolysaccharide biosynthesis
LQEKERAKLEQQLAQMKQKVLDESQTKQALVCSFPPDDHGCSLVCSCACLQLLSRLEEAEAQLEDVTTRYHSAHDRTRELESELRQLQAAHLQVRTASHMGPCCCFVSAGGDLMPDPVAANEGYGGD